ncbi:MAG: MaoC/PaaZ C-terminal domain-containing protein [Arachnia sp.]
MMRTVTTLDGLPAVAGLIGKAVLTSLGRPGAAAGLPQRSLLVEKHQQDAARLAAYNQVCGYSLRTEVPATWLHVLTFPLHAALMAGRDFPFPLAGVVHVTNHMTLHRPVALTENLRIEVWSDNLAPHKRGVTFDLVGEIHVGDELAWSGRSNYMAMGAKMDAPAPPPAARLTQPELQASQLWRLPADLGRQYAAVSGDTNPIHLYPLTAKPFGFKRPIIHGMWTHAKALSSLGPRLPQTFSVDVAFTKPLMLPTKATFAADEAEGAWRFAVARPGSDALALVGRVTDPMP